MGFDADHCMVKFNIEGLFQLLIEGHLKELHDKYQYPEAIMKFDYEKHSALNNAVWDISKGNVLKLGGGKEVSHAMHGWEKLSPETIREVYGQPPIFEALKWPETGKDL